MLRVPKYMIKEVVHEYAGPDGLETVNLISEEAVAEEEIAEIMDWDIKYVRNLLYRLEKEYLVESKRKRNDKNGWYTYFWSFNANRVRDLAKKIAFAKMERYNYQLNVEENTQFFSCKNTCLRVDFESVINMDYECPECGSSMDLMCNKKRIREIKSKIKELKTDMKRKKFI